jgi:hypothetical protein
MKKELQSKDFRQGNFIRFNNKPQRINFKDLEYMEYNQDHKNGIGEMYPIEITRRWLEDFGFTPHDLDLFLNISPRISMVFFDGIVSNFSLVQDGKEICFGHGYLRYLHELQNLYFALTGEELELKNVTP